MSLVRWNIHFPPIPAGVAPRDAVRIRIVDRGMLTTDANSNPVAKAGYRTIGPKLISKELPAVRGST